MSEPLDFTIEIPVLRITLLRITVARRPPPVVPALPAVGESTRFEQIGELVDDVADVVEHRKRWLRR